LLDSDWLGKGLVNRAARQRFHSFLRHFRRWRGFLDCFGRRQRFLGRFRRWRGFLGLKREPEKN
jgi:hypothetical protein